MKIVEVTGGSTTSTKQLVWNGSRRGEERDNSGALTKQFFGRGQKNGSSAYLYAKDHLGSVRQVTDSNATVQAEYSYDPYGEKVALSESVASDFQYTGHYFHPRSRLNLALFRAYMPAIGRWLSRDPWLGREPLKARPAIKLYGYVNNNPINEIDPLGLDDCPPEEDPDKSREGAEPEDDVLRRIRERLDDPNKRMDEVLKDFIRREAQRQLEQALESSKQRLKEAAQRAHDAPFQPPPTPSMGGAG